MFGSPFGPVCRHPDAPLPSFYTRPWNSSTYTGAGLGRNSSIRRKISRNRFRGTATSVSWNVTYRPCLSTFAPIFTSLSRSVVSHQRSVWARGVNFCSWLAPDLNGRANNFRYYPESRHALRGHPQSGAKQTWHGRSVDFRLQPTATIPDQWTHPPRTSRISPTTRIDAGDSAAFAVAYCWRTNAHEFSAP